MEIFLSFGKDLAVELNGRTEVLFLKLKKAAHLILRVRSLIQEEKVEKGGSVEGVGIKLRPFVRREIISLFIMNDGCKLTRKVDGVQVNLLCLLVGRGSLKKCSSGLKAQRQFQKSSGCCH